MMPMPKGRKAPRRLNVRQKMFAEFYAHSGDITNSYKKAYPTVTSDGSAAASGSKLLKDPKIQQAVEDARSEQQQRTEITADWIVAQLTSVYTKAVAADDFNAACTALNMIAKKMGLYEKHQQGKTKYTVEDLPRLKAQLEAAGWNYKDKSYEKAQQPSPN